MQERLQKILARAGIASRRKTEAVIQAGHVTVNGTVATLGSKADAARDDIRIDRQPITFPEPMVYALNKPVDVLSTTSDPAGRSTVLDFGPKDIRLFPVGRLDRMSEGLLLLTNDGNLALELTHPRFLHEKEYELSGRSPMGRVALIARFQRGTTIDGRQLKPDRVEWVGRTGEEQVLRIVLHEGPHHALRRLAARVGFEITHLRRLRIGGLWLADLRLGQMRRLSPEEVALLRVASDHSASPLPDQASPSGGRSRLPQREE